MGLLNLLLNRRKWRFLRGLRERGLKQTNTLISVQAKNEWSYISRPPIYLHGAHRDSLFYLLIFDMVCERVRVKNGRARKQRQSFCPNKPGNGLLVLG